MISLSTFIRPIHCLRDSKKYDDKYLHWISHDFTEISADFSTMQDDYFVLNVADEYGSFLENVFKTEFLTVLSKKFKDRTKQNLNIQFNDV